MSKRTPATFKQHHYEGASFARPRAEDWRRWRRRCGRDWDRWYIRSQFRGSGCNKSFV